ncbi:hypothetical protein NJO91_09960 [Streptomyces microflavus]|uniref:hypothetical protein n=1 Tax=Streptomyces microflavus TaxID=1919 RepID=UPI0029A4F00A|nr:hypothetical protein [Streptomyces microflavus]MDX2403449.1 hypothetical protein [Streptomyces microflavus]
MGGAKKDDKRFVLQGAGPAQSDTLVHFTSRGENASFTPKVPEKFRQMTAPERLDSILGSGRLYGYPPFGAQQACVCFSESPKDHLDHLIADRGFGPWGVVVTRAGVLTHDGGAVAYVTDDVYKRFVGAGLGHWAVPIRENSQWMHEREWRAPLCEDIDGNIKQYSCFSMTRAHAILIGDPNWRPTPITTGYRNGYTGEQTYPNDPAAIPVTELPEMWRESDVWVWNREARSMDIYPAGDLS